MEKKLLVSLIVFVLICMAIWFQINFINIFTFFGVAANLAIVIVVGIGILTGKIPGAIAGATYGILLDILFGKSLGIYFLIYGALGYVCGECGKGFSKDNKATIILMVALFTAIVELVTNIIFIILYDYSFEIFTFFEITVKEIIYNTILARLLIKPISGISEIINKCKNSYYLL